MNEKALLDMHSDIPSKLIDEYETGEDSKVEDPDETVLETSFLPQMRRNNILSRVAAIYIDDSYVPEMSLHRAISQVQHMKNEVSVIDDVEIVETGRKMRDNMEKGKISFMFGMEGVEPLHRNINLADTFYELGVRVVGLTHARRNLSATGPKIFNHNDSINHGGVSEFGVRVLNRLEELGVLIDTVHINEEGFWDVVEHTNNPIVNSHSNARELYDHPRNLSDEQMIAIADTGGVVSINALTPTYSGNKPSVEDMISHIEHTVDVVGIDHVGVGLDFFAYLISPDADLDSNLSGVDGLRDDSEVSNLHNRLTDRFTQDEVEKILWRNNLNVIEKVID